jgi:hypothetical protein
MKKRELSELSDQELLSEAKKLRSSLIVHAAFIGFLIGIMIYSMVVNKWGFFLIILLFFVYKLVMKPNEKKELDKLLKERHLK